MRKTDIFITPEGVAVDSFYDETKQFVSAGTDRGIEFKSGFKKGFPMESSISGGLGTELWFKILQPTMGSTEAINSIILSIRKELSLRKNNIDFTFHYDKTKSRLTLNYTGEVNGKEYTLSTK